MLSRRTMAVKSGAQRASTLAVFMAVLWVIWSMTQLPEGGISIPFLLVTALVPAIRFVALASASRHLDVLDPWLWLPITVGVTFGSGPKALAEEGATTEAATLTTIVVIGMAGYFAGLSVSGSKAGKRSPHSSRTAIAREGGREIALAAFVVGALAMFAYWAQAGGVPLLAADVENSRVAALSGGGIPFYLSFLMMVSAWVAIEFNLLSRPALFCLVTLALLLLASTGWRNTPFAMLAVAGLLYHYRVGVPTIRLLWAGAALVTAAVALGIYRVLASDLTTYRTYSLANNGDYIGAAVVYFQTYALTFSRNLIDVFHLLGMRFDLLHGESFVWNTMALLPGSGREPFDFFLKEAAGKGFAGGGLPPTLFGEWLINFGWAGLFFGMFVIALIARLGHKWATTGSGTWRIIGVVVCFYIFVSVRGGIGNILFPVLILSLSIAGVSTLVRLSPRVRLQSR